MKRIFIVLILALVLISCTPESDPTPEYMQITAEPIGPVSLPESDGIKTYTYPDQLEIGAWQASSDVPSEVNLTKENGQLRADFDTRQESVALLTRGVFDISAPIDGLTITLSVTDRPFHLLAGIRESDKSWYHTTILIHPEDGPTTHEIDFSYLALDQNSTDENFHLDKTQIAEIILVDISGFVGAFGKGSMLIEEIVYWRGNPVLPKITCSTDLSDRNFLLGIDANFVPSGEALDYEWFVNEELVDPIEQFGLQGVNAFRLRTWVGESGESRLDYATELGLRAQDAGLQIAPVFFLTEDWADVSKQPVPEIWKDMNLSEQAEAIEEYSFQTAQHLIEAGITPVYYEIGNEIDYGISGIFADLESRDIETLQGETWIDAAQLIIAAQEGILQADPSARFKLHIAQGNNPRFALAFFQTMKNLGVQLDLVGLSFYPSASGVLTINSFCTTLDRVQNEIGLPVVITEFAYPAFLFDEGAFSGWRHAVPGFPLSPNGQAAYIQTFLTDMRSHPAVVGVNLFEPAFYWEPTIWEAFALYDSEGNARPGLGALTLP